MVTREEYEYKKAVAALRAAKRAEKRKMLGLPEKKKGRKKKSERQIIIDELDSHTSKTVIARDKELYGLCPLCKQREITCAFHFISRRKHIVRWDIKLNVIGSCWACNSAFSGKWGGGNQIHGWDWYIKNKGMDQFEELKEKSKNIAGYKTWELRIMNDKNKNFPPATST